jgi:hypothetical protein
MGKNVSHKRCSTFRVRKCLVEGAKLIWIIGDPDKWSSTVFSLA